MKLFKEVNWGLHEIKRYYTKYGLHISRSYLDKLLKESMIYNTNDIVSNMLEYGFITIENDGVKFTEVGEKMTSFAIDKYELSDHQKRIASNIYIYRDKSLARKWFALFSVDELNVNRSSIDSSLQQFTENMIELNVARQEKNLVYLNKEYTEMIQSSAKNGMTEEELFNILERNKQLGKKAEEIALEFERKRLTLAGCRNLASRVELISQSDVSAGYDIKSFKDDSSETYDAFIEVKCFNYNHFYISENELKTAEMLKGSYYLYLVNTDDGNIRIINNPVINLKKITKSMDAICVKYTL